MLGGLTDSPLTPDSARADSQLGLLVGTPVDWYQSTGDQSTGGAKYAPLSVDGGAAPVGTPALSAMPWEFVSWPGALSHPVVQAVLTYSRSLALNGISPQVAAAHDASHYPKARFPLVSDKAASKAPDPPTQATLESAFAAVLEDGAARGAHATVRSNATREPLTAAHGAEDGDLPGAAPGAAPGTPDPAPGTPDPALDELAQKHGFDVASGKLPANLSEEARGAAARDLAGAAWRAVGSTGACVTKLDRANSLGFAKERAPLLQYRTLDNVSVTKPLTELIAIVLEAWEDDDIVGQPQLLQRIFKEDDGGCFVVPAPAKDVIEVRQSSPSPVYGDSASLW